MFSKSADPYHRCKTILSKDAKVVFKVGSAVEYHCLGWSSASFAWRIFWLDSFSSSLLQFCHHQAHHLHRRVQIHTLSWRLCHRLEGLSNFWSAIPSITFHIIDTYIVIMLSKIYYTSSTQIQNIIRLSLRNIIKGVSKKNCIVICALFLF